MGESEPKRFGSTPDQVRFSPSQGSTRASDRLPAGKQWRGGGSAGAAQERGATRGERGEQKEAFPHTKWWRRRGPGAPGGAPPAPRGAGSGPGRPAGRLGPAPRPSSLGGRSRARAPHSPRTRSRSRGRRRSRGMNGAAAARPRLAARCGRLPLALALARAPAARGRSAAAPRALRGVTHARRSARSLCSAPRPPRIPPPAARGPSSAPGRRPASLRARRRGRCALGQPGGATRPPPRHPRPSLRPARRHQVERDAPAQGNGSVLKSDLGLDTKIGAGKLRGLRR